MKEDQKSIVGGTRVAQEIDFNDKTKKNSDFLFRVNINKKVESLNISNTASVVFHYINK